MPFKRLHSETVVKTKIFSMDFRSYEDSDGQIHQKLAVLDSNDAANIVALTPDQKIVLVKQFRFGIEDYTIEIPGGMIENLENVATGVQRELSEETGYSVNEVKFLQKVQANPVYQSNYIQHFIGFNATLTHQQNLDPAEEIEVFTMPIHEVESNLKKGLFLHPHTISGLFFALEFLKTTNR